MRRVPILRGNGWVRLLAGVLALLAWVSAPPYAGIAGGAAPEGLKSDFSVSGDRMIWFQIDGNGVKQIHYRNLTTGEERKLTNTPSAKDAPYIFGNTVVWADKGSHAPDSVYWDIYSHNLDTGVERQADGVHVRRRRQPSEQDGHGRRGYFGGAVCL